MRTGPASYVAVILYTIPGLLIGLVAHELAHNAVALRLGDPSPRRPGRMTLDPRTHVDPLGLTALVVSGFGWSKPVHLDPVFLRAALPRALVAAAGPVSHLVIAAFFALATRIEVLASGLDVGSLDILAGFTAPRILFGLLVQGFFINVALAIFNALPLPGLDGYAVLRSLLFARIPRLLEWLDRQRLAVYAAAVGVVVALPAATHSAVNPFATATTGAASGIYSHLVEPGVTPLFLGLPNVFALFAT